MRVRLWCGFVGKVHNRHKDKINKKSLDKNKGITDIRNCEIKVKGRNGEMTKQQLIKETIREYKKNS